MGGEQKLVTGQILHEDWEIEYEAGRPGAPIKARLVGWQNSTMYAAMGFGPTVEEARLDLVTNLAKAIHEDPDPFGDLGNVAHISQVVKFLNALKDKGNEEPSGTGDEFRARSDYYLPDQIEGGESALPDEWEEVINKVIDMVKSWADYYPEEEEKGDPAIPDESILRDTEGGVDSNTFLAPGDIGPEDRNGGS